MWSFGEVAVVEEQFLYVTLPFSIPVNGEIEEAKIIYVPGIGANPDPTHCPGDISHPAAAAGYLCIYAVPFMIAVAQPPVEKVAGSGPGINPGARLLFETNAEGLASGAGSFAVTAP